MLTRRSFLAVTTVGLAAPAILRYRPAWSAAARVRRNASTMAPTDPFFSDYAQAVEAMHQLPVSDQRNWRNQALIHIRHCTHGVSDFTHWHRWYVSYFEQICSKLIGKPDFALAYWDWEESKSKVPDPFFDLPKLNVVQWNDQSNEQSDNWGPGRVTTIGARGIARAQTMTSIPQFANSFLKTTLDSIRGQPDFEIFTGLLEGQPHGNAHVAVGSLHGARGHMGSGMSSLDPIFWLHHCNIDRIWAEWQANGNTSDDPKNTYPDSFYDADGKPVGSKTSTGALSLGSFDYIYDTIEPTVIGQISEKLDLQKFDAGGNSMMAKLNLTTPASIGSGASPGPALPNIERAVDVKVTDLVQALSEVRVFLAPETSLKAIEPSRIVARLEGVETPQNTDIAVGVFVNCPYLTPETPSDDKLCAGVFSFFGPGGPHGHHGGPRNVYIDLTDALRSVASQGRLAGNGFKVQLMAVPVAEGVPADTRIPFKGVTILSA
ncbi:tyrosinase family protein [Mesorhizobium sp. LNHC229A00]|uniref:tyrosinase family protein n=1 Tax=Mesorhizobium sp. LNHC229A00 TaxID=1287240 RepID=UPI0003CE6E79|nr:tyrosinase family protein [Mesorhizobium sp. LNHC229A00]ESY92765.1 tyrosinase [Mesorhizobium sp. LNHC229A00]